MRIKQLIAALFRTFIIIVFPKRLIRICYKKGDIVFIANLPDKSVIPKGKIYQLAYGLFHFLPPLLVSPISNLYDKDGGQINGWIIICLITAQEIMKKQSLAKKKVFQSARLAEKLSAKIISLGAFTSIAVHDGLDLVGKYKPRITTGNAYSAFIAVDNARRLARLVNLSFKEATVAVIGAAGSVGSGCVNFLIGEVKSLILVDINLKMLHNMFWGHESYTLLKYSDSLDIVKEADIVIVVTNSVKGIVDKNLLKPGAIVIDGANPPNVPPVTIKSRKDIVVVSSAIAKIPGIHYQFDFGLAAEEVYGCLAEAFLLAWAKRISFDAVGKVSLSYMREIAEISETAGVHVGKFRNRLGWITDNHIENIRKIILARNNN